MKRRRALLFTLSVVLALCAACDLWLHRERQQYALNRQLIAALEHDDTTRALALVNAGANPNTHIVLSPLPTFKSLLHQWLHSTSQTDNAIPSAFMIACGSPWSPNQGEIAAGGCKENVPLIKAMLSHGADLHAKTFGNETALHCAVLRDRLHTVALLLQHGADAEARSTSGCTPLMHCGWNHHPDIVHVLVAQGANPNAQDANGHTAIYYAIEAPKGKEIVAELLKQGADPNWRDKQKDTPLRIARQMNCPDLVHLLKQYGAK